MPNMINYMTQKIKELLSKNVAKIDQHLRLNSLLQSQEPQYQLCKKVSETKSSRLPQYFTKYYVFVCQTGQSQSNWRADLKF